MTRLRRWLANFSAAMLLLVSVTGFLLAVGSLFRGVSAQYLSSDQLSLTWKGAVPMTQAVIGMTRGSWFVDYSYSSIDGTIPPGMPSDFFAGTDRSGGPPGTTWQISHPVSIPPYQHELLGGGYDFSSSVSTPFQSIPTIFERHQRFRIRLSLWLLAILPAALLVPIWLQRKRQAELRGVVQNPCTHCGYDLRATPERCPECGETSSVHQRNHEVLQR